LMPLPENIAALSGFFWTSEAKPQKSEGAVITPTHYEKESDPSYDLYIKYLDKSLNDVREEVLVYSRTIRGSLLDILLEPAFDLITREYEFAEGK